MSENNKEKENQTNEIVIIEEKISKVNGET